jgi:glycerol-3-phosphate dehydrogenase subunit C
VPQPTCAYVLKKEYPDFLGTDDAKLVAEHTFDTSEYLMARNKEEPLDTDFSAGETYDTITWQAACHYRAQQIGPKSRDLMALTGAKVTMLERCSAIDGTWGLRAENVEMARKIAKPLMEAVTKTDADLIAGDCHLSNTAIKEGTGKTPVHPLQVLARAYGIATRHKERDA